MPSSYVQNIEFICLHCQRDFTGDVWYIIDANEHPNLLARVQDGSLNILSCPYCRQENEVDAPLLIFRPQTNPPLLFSPAQQTTPEQDQQQFMECLQFLQAQLGSAWQNQWVTDGLVLPRSMLATALNNDNVQEYLAEVGSSPNKLPHAFLETAKLAQEARQQYLTTGCQRTLNKAIAAWESILQHPTFIDAPKKFQLNVYNEVGLLYLLRYRTQRELSDLDRALHLLRQVLQYVSPGYPEYTSLLNHLGNGYYDHYTHTNHMEDLKKAIDAYQEAVQCTLISSPDRTNYLNDLGNALRARYSNTGQLIDLEKAIDAYREAEACTPQGSPDRALYLNNMGIGLLDRYMYNGHVDDLQAAIDFCREAVQCTTTNSPDRASPFNSLGNALRARYVNTGHLTDLEKAINAYQEAVKYTLPDSLYRASRLNNLGTGLYNRYARIGQLPDLEAAIDAYQEAIACTLPNSTELAAPLNNLGNALRARHARSGQLSDLEAAIDACQQAVQHTPYNSPDYVGHLNNLGVTFNDRYARSGQLSDLEAAIGAYQQAVQHTRFGSPGHAGYLNNLGVGLYNRYEHTTQLADLDAAMDTCLKAMQYIPPNSSNRAAPLNNLGSILRDRHTNNGQLSDLESAIAAYQVAVQCTLSDSPDYVRYLNNLGVSLYYRYVYTGQNKHLQQAIRRYEQALRHLDQQFLLSPVSFQIGQQTIWTGLFARSVTAYYQANQLQSALAIVESTKSRLLTTLLGRSDLPVPQSISTTQITKEKKLSAQLRDLDAAALAQHGSKEQTIVSKFSLSQRQKLVNQLESLWEDISNQSSEAQEYVSLRRGDRPTWESLVSFAQTLPLRNAILSLFIAGEEIYLFLLYSDGSLQVATAELSLADFQHIYKNNYVDEVLNRRMYRQTGRLLTHRWRRLGEHLLAPILTYLKGVEHLIIVPHGPLHLIPLHALTLNNSSQTLLDMCTVSYIPALALLDRLHRRIPITGGETVVLGYTAADEKTQEGMWEREVFLGEAKQISYQLGITPMLDNHASGTALCAKVTNNTLHLLHISSHGAFSNDDPLNSGVMLADGLFTARDFMSLNFRADLVTLSACQTGISNSLGGDEMAGLSQALLYAGASSLLMGLWSVNAMTTAALMTELYQRLWKANSARRINKAQALREACLALRRGELGDFNGIDLTDPYYWAPFVLIGDWHWDIRSAHTKNPGCFHIKSRLMELLSQSKD